MLCAEANKSTEKMKYFHFPTPGTVLVNDRTTEIPFIQWLIPQVQKVKECCSYGLNHVQQVNIMFMNC